MTNFDPAEHTVDEVAEYVAEHPEEADEILKAEKKGKDRSTLEKKVADAEGVIYTGRTENGQLIQG